MVQCLALMSLFIVLRSGMAAFLQVNPGRSGAHRVAALLFNQQRTQARLPQAAPLSRCGFEVRRWAAHS